MNRKLKAISRVATIVIIVVIVVIAAVSVVAYTLLTPSSSNIKIGMAMPLTGALSGNGAAALLALQIWANDTNANGGLLGRHVQLVYYDDATNAQNDPAIYTKLITVDHVDLLISPYGTVDTVPSIAVAQQYNMLMIGTAALGANSQYNYGKYFSMIPAGPQPFIGWSAAFFAMAKNLTNPKPQTVAVLGVQNAYGAPCAAGASQNAVNNGFTLVYNSSYPSTTTDFTSTLEAVQAKNPDILFACSYPPDSVSILQTMKTINFAPKICCGGMVGLGFGTILPTLGPLLNGVVNYEFWAPATTITFPGMTSFLAKYQPPAVAQKLDPLGYYLPPLAYAEGQLLSVSVTATQSLNSTVLANYLHTHTISTIIGNLAFGPSGEWATPRVFYVQFQGITSTGNLSQFEVPSHWTVVAPSQYVSGTLQYPFPGWQ